VRILLNGPDDEGSGLLGRAEALPEIEPRDEHPGEQDVQRHARPVDDELAASAGESGTLSNPPVTDSESDSPCSMT
jgi:hypothetical protein